MLGGHDNLEKVVQARAVRYRSTRGVRLIAARICGLKYGCPFGELVSYRIILFHLRVAMIGFYKIGDVSLKAQPRDGTARCERSRFLRVSRAAAKFDRSGLP